MPAYIVTGLGYGDEGKGLLTDHLVRSTGASKVVLSNGGGQRAHNVVDPSGAHHTFSQFGAGSLAGAETILSKHFLVNPHALFVEWEKLRELGYWMAGKISVQRGALVTTPFHVAANRLREIARVADRHGSCGMGIGETIACSMAGYELRVEDLYGDSRVLYGKLRDIQCHYSRTMYDTIRSIKGGDFLPEARKLQDFGPITDALEIYRIFAKSVPLIDNLDLDPDESVIFEGGQGVLLDQFFGFHPHTTWSTTTPSNAMRMLLVDEMYSGNIESIGVMRSYMTRHGAGPFVTEDPALAERFPEAHNGHGEWQGSWRVGWTDFKALTYALQACEGEIDSLAITHLDRVENDWKICVGYNGAEFAPPFAFRGIRRSWEREREMALKRLNSAEPQWIEFANVTSADFVELVQAHTDLPVKYLSYGPTHEDVRAFANV